MVLSLTTTINHFLPYITILIKSNLYIEIIQNKIISEIK